MAGVKVDSLIKKFGDVLAVKDVSINVADKEFLVLLGPSGCGKTTTLRCIAGLESAESGEISIGSTVVNELPPKDRDVAMVFQSYALYPHMTVRGNIGFPLKMRKQPKEEIEAAVKKTADLLQIGHLLDRKPKQLSGGESQRVALGRAIVRNPRVFLMDEPLSNLDAKLRLYMRAELKSLQKVLGVTTVYVTHDQAEAMTMADRIAIMNLGELQQLDTPDVIYKKPANEFVAGFIGSPPMNLVDCTLAESSGGNVLDCGSFKFDVEGPLKDIIASSKGATDLIFGIRPERIEVSKSKQKGSKLEGEIYVVEPMGSEVIVDVKVGDTMLKCKMNEFSASPGEKVYLTILTEHVQIFDRKTGIAIVKK